MQSWRKGLAAGLGCLGVISMVVGFWFDARSNGVPWLFFVGIAVSLGAFALYPSAAGLRRVRDGFHTLRVRFENGAKYQALEQAAAGWQVRAERAEARLGDWDAESLAKGRSRAVGEVTAAAAGTTFGATELAVIPENEVVIAAKITAGDVPPLKSIFFIEGRLIHDVKAVIRCVGYFDENAVEFRVEQFRSLGLEDLLDMAKASSALPPHFSIVPREQTDDFFNER